MKFDGSTQQSEIYAMIPTRHIDKIRDVAVLAT